MKPKEFTTQLDDARLVNAIADAERKTSGEIRVFISRRPAGDPLAAARKQFERMGMANTARRNGVLLFVAPRSQNFAIIGDKGIHEHCGEAFWRALAEEMTAHFRKSEFTEGIAGAIQKAGMLLAEHFPRHADDKNELADAVERD